jgi:hypothetical protein
MKNLRFSLIYSGLMLVSIIGCIDDNEDKKVEELQSIIRQSGVLDIQITSINGCQRSG